MIRMTLSEAAAALGAEYVGCDVEFAGCDTDSRRLRRDALFIALRGPNFDGHDFLQQARREGAVAALVEGSNVPDWPALIVEDTRRALGELAANWRARFALPLIGVTGSNGKTTVKEMLASIFRLQGPVLATQGNRNNEIGVPLTLFELAPSHRVAVIEMGASAPGEITSLAQFARPAVGVVTQCGPSHLQGFGDVAAVARAKGELFAALPATGTAVINADDPYCELWRELAGARPCLRFGLEQQADVSGTWRAQPGGTTLSLHTPCGDMELRLQLPGRHNVMNALAAAAAALACDVPLATVATGLAQMTPFGGRLVTKTAQRRASIIDDTYNANPASLGAGLNVLADFPSPRWLVLGDMGELGGEAQDFHRQAGELARRHGVERLYAVGELSAHAVRAFGRGGRHYADQDSLIAATVKDLRPGVAVLVKGSRMMRMERVVAALVEAPANADCPQNDGRHTRPVSSVSQC
jgi:UDP-N-acetylmuramoyl-tripeptide--D-alanyl-D-alanine ligase